MEDSEDDIAEEEKATQEETGAGGRSTSVTDHHVPGTPSDMSNYLWEIDWLEAYRSCPEWSQPMETILNE